jgi:hypothetical protein
LRASVYLMVTVAASFDLFLTAFGASSGSCGVYTQLADYRAVVFFRLQDGSTLTLDEAGTACYPGKSAAPASLTSFGNPRSWSATWLLQDATGVFANVTGGGADSGRSAGSTLFVLHRQLEPASGLEAP